MTRAAVRPSREEFARLCQGYTARAIANRYGVTLEAVRKWRHQYGVRPRLARTGRKPFAGKVYRVKPLPATPGPINGYWLAARGCGE